MKNTIATVLQKTLFDFVTLPGPVCRELWGVWNLEASQAVQGLRVVGFRAFRVVHGCEISECQKHATCSSTGLGAFSYVPGGHGPGAEHRDLSRDSKLHHLGSVKGLGFRVVSTSAVNISKSQRAVARLP